MNKLACIFVALFLTSCADNTDYYTATKPFPLDSTKTAPVKVQEFIPPPAYGDKNMVIIPGGITWNGRTSTPTKVVIEITFGKDSTFTYNIKTTGK